MALLFTDGFVPTKRPTMRRSIKVERGKTGYYVCFTEAGEVESGSGVAVISRSKPGKRGRVWGGGVWLASSGKPIPKQLQPIVDEAKRLHAADAKMLEAFR